MAGTDRQAFDNILTKVARMTKQDTEINALGEALNIPSYDIGRATVGNQNGRSYMGSLDLLRDWTKRQKSSTMRQTLMDALKKIPREDILSACFPEPVADTVTFFTKTTPSRTFGLQTDTRGDSRGHDGADGSSQSSTPPHDSSGQHGAVGPGQPPTPPDDKWKYHTVKPAKSGPNESDREMQYVMWESDKKGNALIIGNADFPGQRQIKESHRPWADKDISNMKGLLEKLGYDLKDTNIHRSLSKSEMETAFQQFTKQLKAANPTPQSAVVYISSHGNEEGIEGRDRIILPIRDLLKEFSEVLLGKPKVLIIDACWGGDKTSLLPVSMSSSSSGTPVPPTPTVLPENADIFMIHSTSYGKKTWSFTTNGSWFVDELCKVVYSKDRDLEDLDTIMLRVTKGVHKIESVDENGEGVGTQSTTVFKQGVDRKLFFYPGFPPNNV